MGREGEGEGEKVGGGVGGGGKGRVREEQALGALWAGVWHVSGEGQRGSGKGLWLAG